MSVTDAESFAERTGATPRQMEDLCAYRDLLFDWSGRMNLIGPSVRGSFWPRHLWDSAQLLHVEQGALGWADVGAGAGFPGVVLAIMLKGRVGAHIHLIESLAKRGGFLSTVVEALDLPASIHHGRSEDVHPPEDVEVVTARACAPLPRLLLYTQRFFAAGARGAFLKGRSVETEIEDARKTWRFEAEVVQSLSDPDGRVLRVQKVRPR